MRSGSHVQLAALRNRDLELQTTSPFSNHGSVERSTACFRHKNVSIFVGFFKSSRFFVSPCIYIYIYLFIFENLAFCEIAWKNDVEPERRQMTIWRMRFTCWIPKAINTTSECAILVALPQQQWLHERA